MPAGRWNTLYSVPRGARVSLSVSRAIPDDARCDAWTMEMRRMHVGWIRGGQEEGQSRHKGQRMACARTRDGKSTSEDIKRQRSSRKQRRNLTARQDAKPGRAAAEAWSPGVTPPAVLYLRPHIGRLYCSVPCDSLSPRADRHVGRRVPRAGAPPLLKLGRRRGVRRQSRPAGGHARLRNGANPPRICLPFAPNRPQMCPRSMACGSDSPSACRAPPVNCPSSNL